MNIVEMIRKKRDGGSLTEEEFHYLISGYIKGDVPDYQMSAFMMACYFCGMNSEETRTFTRSMLHSGEVVDLSDIPGTKVDKHSTGGVGDKISLILTPMVAACDVPVPMISERSLGHTGCTIDKLESIPGLRTDLTIAEYKHIISKIGAVIIGQTKELAPTDKKIYALRDITATIECIPLIAGSIMSKKLAEGIDALVLDVKTGLGAFMQTYERSLELTKTLVAIGNGFGKDVLGFITDMNQPLGVAIGNWLEVVEAVDCLHGNIGSNDESADLMELTYVLSGAMVYLGKKAKSIEEGIDKCKKTIENGSAYRKLIDIVRAQGGDVTTIENLERYPLSKYILEVKSRENGYISEIDSFEVGMINILLGAGREKIDDVIDVKAGIILKKKIGDEVDMGDSLAVFYTDRENVLTSARMRIANAIKVSSIKPLRRPLILDIVDKDGVRKCGELIKK